MNETLTPQNEIKREYKTCPRCGCTLFADDDRPCKSDLNPHFDPRLRKLHDKMGSKPEHWE